MRQKYGCSRLGGGTAVHGVCLLPWPPASPRFAGHAMCVVQSSAYLSLDVKRCSMKVFNTGRAWWMKSKPGDEINTPRCRRSARIALPRLAFSRVLCSSTKLSTEWAIVLLRFRLGRCSSPYDASFVLNLIFRDLFSSP